VAFEALAALQAFQITVAGWKKIISQKPSQDPAIVAFGAVAALQASQIIEAAWKLDYFQRKLVITPPTWLLGH
jgi:hypothetical protein